MARRPRFRTTLTALRREGASERGSQTVEALIVLPILFGVFFVIVQGAVWLHAGNIAQAAASSAYNAARLYDAVAADGVAAGTASAQQTGTVLDGAVVVVDRTITTVTVTVSGNAPTLVPGWDTRVERTVSGPVERWITP
ncbi:MULTISPECIES: TadE/TadG family type IV pilus assembly protein [Cryobacterium]|uniref:TadE/TadG family type IV pilus assembly protein n=1 Tax=Cryobacterium TaxID=69578 RepID=UPI000CD3E934|nr:MULTISPECIES: TadE family protein [Cryobacterium]POH64610.1 TadE protein [Cryobacterium zongtaii]TFC46321.1 pilus assembly protein [Cryobacterium sp. TMN-39-2]